MRIRFSGDEVRRFASWSCDVNPLHVDPSFARTTYFGRPVVHGVLSVLGALTARSQKPEADDAEPARAPSRLEVDFRGAVFPDHDYEVERSEQEDGFSVSVKDGESVVLTVRGSHASSAPRDAELDPARWPATEGAARAPLRTAPAERPADELSARLELAGVYEPGPVPGEYQQGSGLSPQHVRVLGLCSYLVGMELPGLRSLFTRAALRFTGASADDGPLQYHVQVVRFDPAFRLLDTRLYVRTARGAPVAVCDLRSYVRVTPLVADPAAIARWLGPAAGALAGKTALVSGASRGLGASIAAALALAGCRVYGTYRTDAAGAARLAVDLGGRGADIRMLQGDAGDAAWCQTIRQDLEREHGGLDLLVLNACSPASRLRLGPDSAEEFHGYIADNLRLASAPLAALLPVLDRRRGAVLCISSSFVEQPPPGLGHYVALKRAVEETVRAASVDSPGVYALIARPGRLQTSWNDVPTAVAGSMAPDAVGAQIVNRLAEGWQAGRCDVLAEFSAVPVAAAAPADAKSPSFTVAVAASFTADPLVPGLKFWFDALDIAARVELAPYGQVLQTLLSPDGLFRRNTRGANVVLLRVSDWLRDLPAERTASAALAREHLGATAQELVRALHAHRAQSAAETLLVVCPSSRAFNDDTRRAIAETEAELAAALGSVPGMQAMFARGFHALYEIAEDDVDDPVRDDIGHIPFKDPYFHVLATLTARHLHHRFAPVRKVVVVDCDNTLWDGVVGEAGPDGIRVNEHHRELQVALVRLAGSGVLVALCSRNEESDVWQVFDGRSDMPLRREHIVAAMVNWRSKGENLRTLAGRLNLGLDSFIFIDDNPVECAEVRASCPEVLTLQWPSDPARALRLLAHTWELDARKTTAEDRARTESYRDEFRRHELRDRAMTFREFIDGLELAVDIRPLDDEDLPRASQLTFRTNQFNFTTRRRSESEMRSLLAGGRHEAFTVRVRDRFGDYGLVGVVITEDAGDEGVSLDTFLLSCRVLGRGVEHRIAAEVGRRAAARGARSVRLRIEPTKRNAPARSFLASIAGAAVEMRAGEAVEWVAPAGELAAVQFSPDAAGGDVMEEETHSAAGAPADAQRVRAREGQIVRTFDTLATAAGLRDAVGAGASIAAPPARVSGDVAASVHRAFAAALSCGVEEIVTLDRLEALGCDSMKIVEITVALLDEFPSLPHTLLFEHRSVSDIVRAIQAQCAPPADRATTPVPLAAAPTITSTVGSPADIAVVGMHVRCAGARSPGELWALLAGGATAVTPVPADRPYFLHPLHDTRPHWAGLLDDVDCFDSRFFGISPREAEVMDPQLRLFLEVAWDALEDAGCSTDRDPDTGVFAGVMYGDYREVANRAMVGAEAPYRSWEGFSLANRLSQTLGFRGPSIAVDTACSSSGTALHLACRALNAGDCNVAVVGGVNLILDPDRFTSLGRLGILSATGQCHAFGADADGTVLGEGAAVVVLRPLADALRRGDRIYGVVKGTGVSVGSGSIGFTAPNPQAQAEAIRRSLRAARIDPRTISYIETHGTGTALGDPIEVRGLALAHDDVQLHERGVAPGPARCRIGSIKPNVGHLEAGAGVIGLIKVLLQMQGRMLAPSLTSPDPNPQIPFADTRFEVQRTLEPWEQPVVEIDGHATPVPRRAGVSSFGVGGANAHVIVEEPPDLFEETGEGAPVADRPCHVLTVSGPTDDVLRRQLAAFGEWIERPPDATLPDVCYTAAAWRPHHAYRAAIVAASMPELQERISRLLAGREAPHAVTGGPVAAESALRPVFLFTGQGSQYPGMGRWLYDSQPVFRQALDRCASLLDALLDRPLLPVMFADADGPEGQLVHLTGYTQPALFAFEYALSELWRAWGIEPAAVMGHSVGEIGALCVAGGMSLEDGVRLIAARGRLMQALPAGGAMASVMAPERTVLEALAAYGDVVTMAALNAPAQVVISGDEAAVSEITAQFASRGIKATRLTVSHAFHSPLMRPMLAEYEAVVRGISFSPPRIPFVSCVTGGRVDAEVCGPEYWIRQVLDPVRFVDGMRALHDLGTTAYLEVGPQPVLLGMGRQCVPDEGQRWLPSVRKDADASWPTLLAAAARLHVDGAAIDWKAFDAPYRRRRVSLPGYAFAKTRYWVSATPSAVRSAALPGAAAAAGARIYDLAWEASAADAREDEALEHATRRWLILADRGGVAEALADLLRGAGGDCTLVHQSGALDNILRASGDEHRIDAIVHLWALDEPVEAGHLIHDAHAAVEHAVRLCQDLASRSAAAAPALWFVTHGAVAAGAAADAPVSVEQAPLWGLARTLWLEHPELRGGIVDLPGVERPDAGLLRRLAAELISGGDEGQVALRTDGRFLPRLRLKEAATGQTATFNADASYLITGGLGAIGLHVARWAVARGARHLVLAGRRGADTPGAGDAIAGLEAAGATVRVEPADAARAGDVRRLVEAAAAMAPLRGVFHAAGFDRARSLRDLTPDDLSQVLAPKIDGAWLLHEATRDCPLDMFVCFSSMASVVGASSRAHYAAANAFLDALAYERRRLGLPALTVSWGPWAGGGIATADVRRQFERIGNRPLEPVDALETLDRLICGDAVHAMVADVDWERFGAVYDARGLGGFLAHVKPPSTPGLHPAAPLVDTAAADGTAGAPARAGEGEWSAALAAAGEAGRPALLTTLLRQEVAGILGFPGAADVPLDRPFTSLGMDSLAAADLTGRLRRCLGVRGGTAVFDYPTVDALASHLLGQVSVAPPQPLVTYSREIEGEILEFQRAAFPSRREDLVASRWRWMFVDSARRLGVAPQMWLYRNSPALVGQLGAMPVRLKVHDEEYLTAWLVEAMVLQEYRSLAVGSRLMVAADAELPFGLSLGQEQEMREIQFRLGWEQVVPLQTAQLLLRPDRVLKTKVGAPVAFAAGAGLRAYTAARRGWRRRVPGEVREVARFGDAHDRLWKDSAPEMVCAVVRDSSYLNWKYVDQPGQEFLRLELVRGGRAAGVAVCMFREPDAVYAYRRAFLVDVVAPLGDDRLLRDLLLVAARAAEDRGADALTCLHTDARLTKALQGVGFLLREPERVLLVRPGTLPAAARQHLLSPGAWHVTHGDSDIDRPW